MSGEWAPVMAYGPPSLSVGQPFLHPDNRVVIELAHVTPANVDHAGPYIVWVDITDRVIEATWSQGSTNGAESRWPIGQCTIDCYHLVDEVADFLTGDPDTRLGPGSLLRVSMLDAIGAVTWWPQFSGIIDSIVEADTPGPRTWRITAFDVLYQAAGDTGLAHWTSVAAGADLGTAIEMTFGYMTFFRFALDVPTSGTVVSQAFDIAGNLLALAHRLADSYGCRLYGYRDGIVRVRPWDHVENSTAPLLVDAHNPLELGEVYATPSWSVSTARVAPVLAAFSPLEDLAPALTVTDFDLQSRQGNRQDAPGWPKLDLLYAGAFTGSTLGISAAPRYRDELSLDRIDVDTQRNTHTTVDVDLLRVYGPGDRIMFRRGFLHSPGTPLDCTCLILGAQHRINRVHGKERWQCSYYPKIVDYGPPP